MTNFDGKVHSTAYYMNKYCIGFAWPDFGREDTTGMISGKVFWKLPPCLREAMPAGSRMDLLLAKAYLMRKDGSAL